MVPTISFTIVPVYRAKALIFRKYPNEPCKGFELGVRLNEQFKCTRDR
jgi:hypothetical protein